jgi:hypothetical protein
MRSSRLTALVILAGTIAGGLLVQAAEDPAAPARRSVALQVGVAMPTASPPGTLTSTWYCAGGSATENGFADHVLLLANPTDEPRRATVTVLPGTFASPPAPAAEAAGETTTSTTAAPETTSTTAVVPPPEPRVVELPAQSRIEVSVRELVDAKLAGAIVEVDGGEVAVEHQITGRQGGVATAPCSTTAARAWSFPWGSTLRGTRELLVFMNPFPDDATVDIRLATNEDNREPARLQNVVVRGRSVLGVFIEQDGRREHVSADVNVASGRLIVDRIMTFDGTDPTREGITLGLGAASPAETWIFPDGRVGAGITEQIVVFNPTEEVAEVDVEARLDDPSTNGVPEPFELSIQPGGFSIVDLSQPETPDVPKRIPDDVAHSVLVRSLNGVGVTAERVITSSEPRGNLGIAATLGSPVAAPTWIFPGGGVTDERDEFLTLFNPSDDDIVRFSVTALADGQTIAVQDLQNLEIAPGTRRSIHLTEHVDNRERLPLVVEADGPIVVERGLYRVQGRGISLSMGIPLAVDIFIPDPLAG